MNASNEMTLMMMYIGYAKKVLTEKGIKQKDGSFIYLNRIWTFKDGGFESKICN